MEAEDSSAGQVIGLLEIENIALPHLIRREVSAPLIGLKAGERVSVQDEFFPALMCS